MILPFYNSVNTDNDIRLATAQTYGCFANVDIFSILQGLLTAGGLSGSGFWEFLVTQFPSSNSPSDDKRPQAAEYGLDAAMSAVKYGTFFTTAYEINSNTDNVGSILVNDRIDDANAYITFLSMALMGALMNRNGFPLSNHHKGAALPWTTADLMPGEGCAFASAVLNFKDSIQFISSVSPSNLQSAYSAILSLLSNLDTACQIACFTNCGGMSCSGCPTALRNRDSCTGLTTDQNSCAGTGIISSVNSTWTGPP